MKRWSIYDARFTILFTYLTHFYKVKLIAIATEKINSEFLDNYDSPQFYEQGSCTIIESFFKFAKGEFALLANLKNSDIFEAVYYETVRRIMFLFFKHFYEVIKHPKFEMPVTHMNWLISEFLNFPKYWKSFSKPAVKTYGFTQRIFDWCVRLPALEKLVEDSITLLVNKLVDQIATKLQTATANERFDGFSIANLLSKVANKEKEFGELPAKVVSCFEIAKYDIILESITKKIIAKSESNIETHLEAVRDDIVSHMAGHKNTKLDDQVVYIEQLTTFMISLDVCKCQNALSAIQNLLSFKFTKPMLMSLIQCKNYGKDKILEDRLKMTVSQHFDHFKQFQEKRDFHKKANKKLVTFINAIIFLIRYKTKQFVAKRKQPVVSADSQNNTRLFINEFIDEGAINNIKSANVKFQIVTKAYIKTTFKNYTLVQA